MAKTKRGPLRSGRRSYIIALSKWRSRSALIASLISISFTLYAIACGIVYYTERNLSTSELFHWFTTNSNFLTLVSSSMIVPFAVEGARKKYLVIPKWVAMFHYSGMVCTTLTMVFAVGFMSWIEPAGAFGGYNLYLHVVCPIMVILAFFMVESGFDFTLRDSLIATAPSLLYMLVYTWQVVIVGKANGGWEDLYHIMEFMHPALAILIIGGLAAGISLLIRLLYNKLTAYRRNRMRARLWPKDVNPVEIKVEVFGLGRYMGKHADGRFIQLPLGIIKLIAHDYDISVDELIKPYIKGFMDSLAEKGNT